MNSEYGNLFIPLSAFQTASISFSPSPNPRNSSYERLRFKTYIAIRGKRRINVVRNRIYMYIQYFLKYMYPLH